MKLNLGSGRNSLNGYINIDIEPLVGADLVWDAQTFLPYDDGTIDEILVYHLLEHFEVNRLKPILRHWRRLLKPGGTLIIESPDFAKLFPFLLEKVESDEKDWDWVSWAIYAGEKHGHRCALTAGWVKQLLGSGWSIVEEAPTRDTGFPAFRLKCVKQEID